MRLSVKCLCNIHHVATSASHLIGSVVNGYTESRIVFSAISFAHIDCTGNVLNRLENTQLHHRCCMIIHVDDDFAEKEKEREEEAVKSCHYVGYVTLLLSSVLECAWLPSSIPTTSISHECFSLDFTQLHYTFSRTCFMHAFASGTNQ